MRYFFNPPEPAIDMNNMEAYSKAKEASERVFNRIGWRSIYGRLIESGFFSRPDQTPIQSAMAANFEDAAILMSNENAKVI